jgi:4-amino-4-deoxy-L-arabinose transferase-like glycosyltransferase
MSLRTRALLFGTLSIVCIAPAIDQAASGHWPSAILGGGTALGEQSLPLFVFGIATLSAGVYLWSHAARARPGSSPVPGGA